MYVVKNNRSQYYQLIYKRDDKWTSVSTGKKDKPGALNFLSEFENKFKKNSVPNSITIKAFRKEYVEQISILLSEKYVKSVEYSFNQLIKSAGNIKMDQVNLRSIEKFLLSTYKKSMYAAALHHRTLKTAFNKAKEWEYISENPFTNIKLPSIPKKIPVFIDASELKQILDNTKSQLFKDIFITGFLTGMRLGELLNLKWNAVDLKTKIITVRNTREFTTKSKKERVIPINQELLIVLKKRFPKVINYKLDEYVFWKMKDVKLNNDFVSKQFKKAVRAAEINERIHFHTLRHSFASQLVQKGVSLYVIKELLGHSDLKTTQIYAHISSSNLVDAVMNLSVY